MKSDIIALKRFALFRCGCPVGYQLSADGVSCEDVDECQVALAGCSHFCANTLGSFQCRLVIYDGDLPLNSPGNFGIPGYIATLLLEKVQM